MKYVIRVIVFAALLGAGVWLWLHFHPSPQEAIRRQLAQLAQTASYQGSENLLAQAVAVQKLSSLFAEQVRMDIEPSGIFEEDSSRQDIAARVVQFRSLAGIRALKVKILDPVITLGADRQSAIVELTINAETAGERHLVVQEMKFTMKKVEREWLIIRVETVRTLNRAPRQLPANLPTAA